MNEQRKEGNMGGGLAGIGDDDVPCRAGVFKVLFKH